MDFEPLMFTQFFPAWDKELYTKTTFLDPYEAKLQAQRAAAAEDAGEEPPPPIPVLASRRPSYAAVSSKKVLDPVGGFKPSSENFPLDELQNSIPEGVDPTKKEEYLSDADFLASFGMTLPEYRKLPAWRQKNKKIELKLF